MGSTYKELKARQRAERESCLASRMRREMMTLGWLQGAVERARQGVTDKEVA